MNHNAVFKQRTQKDDNDELSFELIISTRKSGQLDMSGRGLAAGIYETFFFKFQKNCH